MVYHSLILLFYAYSQQTAFLLKKEGCHWPGLISGLISDSEQPFLMAEAGLGWA